MGDRASFLDYANRIFDQKWLTNCGPLVLQFEDELARFLGVRHCLAVFNATIGLEIAIRALDLRGEVIVPSFTFVATAHALQWLGIAPVFADIDPATHNLDPGAVEARITPRTTGILGVHLWGRPCEADALRSIARKHNLKLLFDAAHAFGNSHRGTRIGNLGDAEVFSFHATKFFNTFEGGAIATNDEALARRIRLMRNFGFAGYDDVESVGTNGKMNEIVAAMGLVNLQSLEAFVAINRRNYQAYQAALADLPGLRLIAYDAREQCNYQYIVVEVDERVAGLSRDVLLAALHAENVLARRYFWPGCHRMEPYRTRFPDAGSRLAQTERVADRVLVLPTGAAVSTEDIAVIGGIVRSAIARAARSGES
jgi:dTDP-4-amino-4,6-dideoxygalactose transaminase